VDQNGSNPRRILIGRVKKFQTVLVFFVAVLLSTVLASTVGTQLVLSEIRGFGLETTLQERLVFTLHDMTGFGPSLYVLIGVTFLIAFLFAALAMRMLGGNRIYWYMAAGFSSLPLALLLIRLIMGVSVFAASRTLSGILLVALCGMCGGWLFERMTRKGESVQ
jgi:hypothetical protein